ncbi:PAS domain-containing protein [Aureococcus anophagefferens]|nr:PAS domain-containing protein [Aureococcus anophagefferens]
MRALDDAGDADDKADELHELYLADVGDGIGQQQRTKATQRLWATARKKGNAASGSVRRTVEKEAERTLQSLAFDAFPRFLKTDLCSKAMKAMKQSGGKSATDAALADNLEKMGSMAPQDADEWLSSFISFAETWPACIVVSDMTILAPMVYVNPEFCRVTEYPREEAVGRNCRFLQGPDTEPESIQVIQETLCKGEDCHTHVQFAREAADVLRDDLESKASKKQLRKLHLRMRHNPIFYCTRTEIVIGDIDETAWEPIRKEVAWGLDVSTKFLAADLLPRVLRSETGRSIVEHVRRQELESAETHLHTCAHGVSTETSDERYWLDMFSGTGYGPEQIGKKCTFLQGPETEQYLIDEIVTRCASARASR